MCSDVEMLDSVPDDWLVGFTGVENVLIVFVSCDFM